MANSVFAISQLFAVCFPKADGKELADGKVADSSSGRPEAIPSRGEECEHDLHHTYPQEGVKMRTSGRLRPRASGPEVQPMIGLPDHF